MNLINPISFSSADELATLEANWYLPTRKATDGAVIVAHGPLDTKDSLLLNSLCEGVAGLGLTAVSFNFRYVERGLPSFGTNLSQDLDDLLGAYQFLQSFGKEIKPKRYYLIGESTGGICALKAVVREGPLAGAINGLTLLGGFAVQFDGYILQYESELNELEQLTCPTLVVAGQQETDGTVGIRSRLKNATVPTKLELIQNASYGYRPVPTKGEPPLTTQEIEAGYQANLERVADIVLKWLEKQDQIREDLRK